jgi:hypothetical protein
MMKQPPLDANRRKKQRSFLAGFTIVELIVGLVIGTILILIIAAMSNITLGSYERIRKEAQVYQDVFRGFELMKHSCRNLDHAVDPVMVGNTITFGTRRFWINGQDFVYTDPNGDHAIISGVNELAFNFFCGQDAAGNWIVPCIGASTIFHVTLSGVKDTVRFTLSTDITRRN